MSLAPDTKLLRHLKIFYMGLLDSVFGSIVGAIQLGQAGKINPQYTPYTTSPYASANLSNATNAYNGRMAGASTLEQNILANEANSNAGVDKSATDSAQALAAKAANVGQTNQSFKQVQTQEAQNKYQLLNNLNLANQGMVQEGDKTYQAMLQKYQMDLGQQGALRQAGLTNISNGLGGLGVAVTMDKMGGSLLGGKTDSLLSLLF